MSKKNKALIIGQQDSKNFKKCLHVKWVFSVCRLSPNFHRTSWIWLHVIELKWT